MPLATAASPQAPNTPLNALDFPGVDPSGALPSDAGFAAFVRACLGGGGHDCFVPPGRFRFEHDLVLDFAANRDGGVHFHGSGQNASLFVFATGQGMKVVDTRGEGIFYGSFDNFGVLADHPSGAALELGRPDFADALNGFAFRDVFVKNIAGTANSQGLALNEVYSSVFSNVTTSAGCRDENCPQGGDALVLRQAAFDTFQGSFSDAHIGVHLTGGYNFGNVFQALDEEVNFIDLVIDSASSRYNTFVGGQWHWYQGPGHAQSVQTTAGLSNVIDNVNFSGPEPIGATVGLSIRGSLPNLVRTPAFPASGMPIGNATGRTIAVQVFNMPSGSIFCFQNRAAVCIAPTNAGGIVTLPFRPDDQIKLTYSAPGGAWVWTELY